MTRSFKLIAVAAVLGTLLPIGARANHCAQDVIIFSGVDTGQTDPNGAPIRPGPNGTIAGCQVDPSDESLALIYPGATNMVVAYTAGGSEQPTGTITFNGQTTDLVFTWMQPLYATSARWESQSIPTQPGAGPVTATVYVGGEEINSVTYNKLA